MQTSAVSTAPSEWHQIDWARTQGTVRRLQARMVKATQAGDWRRVKALQRFLARSFSGKALAATSDGKSGQTHAGRGWCNVVHPGGKATSYRVAQTAWLSATSPE